MGGFISGKTDIGDLANGYLGYAASSQSGIEMSQRDVRDAIEDAVDRVVKNQMEETARAFAPTDTGQLANAIDATPGSWQGDEYNINLQVDRSQAPHVSYLERGTRSHVITPKGFDNEVGWVDANTSNSFDGPRNPFEEAQQLPAVSISVGSTDVGMNFAVVRHPGISQERNFLARAGNVHRNDLKNEIRAELLTDAERIGFGSVPDSIDFLRS